MDNIKKTCWKCENDYDGLYGDGGLCDDCLEEYEKHKKSKLEKEIKMTLLDCVLDADLAQTSLLLQELRKQIICNTL